MVYAARRNVVVEMAAWISDVITGGIGTVGRGIKVCQCLPDLVDPARWDDVVGKRCLGERIDDGKSRLRHEAEIAGSFRGRWHQGRAADGIPLSHPLVIVEKEGLVLAVIEPGQPHGPADGE